MNASGIGRRRRLVGGPDERAPGGYWRLCGRWVVLCAAAPLAPLKVIWRTRGIAPAAAEVRARRGAGGRGGSAAAVAVAGACVQVWALGSRLPRPSPRPGRSAVFSVALSVKEMLLEAS